MFFMKYSRSQINRYSKDDGLTSISKKENLGKYWCQVFVSRIFESKADKENYLKYVEEHGHDFVELLVADTREEVLKKYKDKYAKGGE